MPEALMVIVTVIITDISVSYLYTWLVMAAATTAVIIKYLWLYPWQFLWLCPQLLQTRKVSTHFDATMFTSSHSHPPAGPATSTSDTSPRHQKRRLSLPGAVVLHSHSQTSLVFFIARTLNLRHRATHPRRKKEHKNRILCVSKRISFGPMLLLDKNVTLIPLSFR